MQISGTLLMSYCIFLSSILSPMTITTLYTLYSKFFGKCNKSSDERVVSVTKNEYFFCNDWW